MSLTNLRADVRYSLRVFRNSPGFVLAAILALALGIGANTAIFSVINQVLLKPLPFRDSERILRLQREYPRGAGPSISIPKFMVWRMSQAFQSMALYDFAPLSLNSGSADHPEPLPALHVSAGFFDTFGASPVLGRTFTPEEDLPNAGRFVVLTYNAWKNHFGSDPGLAGRAILLNSQPYVVTGVLAADFQLDPPVDLLLPLQADPNSTNQGHYLNVAGRLKKGATPASARAEMKIIGEQFRAMYPDTMDKNETVGVIPLREALGGEVRTALLVMAGAVAFVLLIACANVANLLLARAAARQKEIAIRCAVGAGRARIVQQLLTESVLLSLAGGGLGFVLGTVGLRALLAASPGNIPRISDANHAIASGLALDWRVMAFLAAISLFTGVLFGLFPALQVSRLDVNSVLKDTSGRSGTGLRHNRIQGLLVVGEIALALVLLMGAALMIRTYAGLHTVQPGFETKGLLTFKTSLAGGKYDTADHVENLIRQATERIEGLPGVGSAASTIMLPLEGGGIDLPFTIEGKTPTQGKWEGDEQWRYVSADYFRTLKIPLLRGRLFDERDTGKASRVVIVNEAFVKKYWPQGDPVGRQIMIGKGLGPDFDEPTRVIAGIVGNVHEEGLAKAAGPVMYVPAGQVTNGLIKLASSVIPLSWAVRGKQGDAMPLAAMVERELLAVDGQLAPSKVRSMEQVIEESTARENFNMLVLTVFGGVALLLAAIGIYGVVSYNVEQRTQEIGIRMALGAGREKMVHLLLGQGMRLAAIGMALGGAAAWALIQVLSKLLPRLNTGDPVTYSGVAALLGIAALAAVMIPARRVTRIDPMVAVRHE